MAKSVNKVILLGNVGKDPEIRSTAGGTMVANFTLATSDRQKDAQGNWQDRTEWHNLVAFTRLAVDLGSRRGLDPQPGGLRIKVSIELRVVLIHVDGSAGERL